MFCCIHAGLHVFDSFFPAHLGTFYQPLPFGRHLRDGVSSRTSNFFFYLYLRGSIFGILLFGTIYFYVETKDVLPSFLTRKTQFYRRPPMRIISFFYNYKLNDLLKETCTYSAIIKAVQVFNRGQTGFPAHLPNLKGTSI